MIIQIRIEVKGEEKLQRVVRQAILLGYTRIDPKKAWSQLEYKEAARYAFEKLCTEILK